MLHNGRPLFDAGINVLEGGPEQTFRQAIAADPTYASPYYSLSILLRKQGRLQEADNRPHLRESRELLGEGSADTVGVEDVCQLPG